MQEKRRNSLLMPIRREFLRLSCMTAAAFLCAPQGAAFTSGHYAGRHVFLRDRRQHMAAEPPAGAPSSKPGGRAALYFGAGGAMDKRLAKVETEVQSCRADNALVLIDGMHLEELLRSWLGRMASAGGLCVLYGGRTGFSCKCALPFDLAAT